MPCQQPTHFCNSSCTIHPDPSRCNPANWSAVNYFGRSVIYTPKDSQPAEMDGIETDETSRPAKKLRTPLPTHPIPKSQTQEESDGRPGKRLIPTLEKSKEGKGTITTTMKPLPEVKLVIRTEALKEVHQGAKETKTRFMVKIEEVSDLMARE